MYEYGLKDSILTVRELFNYWLTPWRVIREAKALYACTWPDRRCISPGICHHCLMDCQEARLNVR